MLLYAYILIYLYETKNGHPNQQKKYTSKSRGKTKNKEQHTNQTKTKENHLRDK